MLRKIKRLSILSTAVVVISALGLGLAKYLNLLPDIQPKLKIIVSSLTLLLTQFQTYLSSNECLLAIEITFVTVLVLFMIIIRLSMIRKVLS